MYSQCRGVNTDDAAKFFGKQVYIEELKNTHHIITLEFNACINAYFPPYRMEQFIKHIYEITLSSKNFFFFFLGFFWLFIYFFSKMLIGIAKCWVIHKSMWFNVKSQGSYVAKGKDIARISTSKRRFF